MFLSIAVFTYNRGNRLGRTLETLASQIRESGRSDIELVVSDNASTDNTAEIVENAHRQYGFIRYFRNPINIGLIPNYMKAIRLSQGKYVWPFSDDDLLQPGALEKVVSVLSQQRCAYMIFNFSRVSETSGKVLCRRVIPQESSRSYGSILDLVYDLGFGEAFSFVSAAVFGRVPMANVDEAPYLGQSVTEQMCILLEAFARHPCYYLDESLVHCNTPDEVRWVTDFEKDHKLDHRYMSSVALLRKLKVARQRGVIPEDFIERACNTFNNLAARQHVRMPLSHMILSYVAFLTANSYENREKLRPLNQQEWDLVISEFSNLKDEGTKKQLQILYRAAMGIELSLAQFKEMVAVCRDISVYDVVNSVKQDISSADIP